MRFSTILATILVGLTCVSAELNADLQGEDKLNTNDVQPFIFENTIKEMMKKLSEDLAKKDPALIPNVTVNVKNDLANLDFEATDILVRGFSKFELTHIKISAITLKADFNLEFEQLQLVVPYYKLDALAVFIPFYGSGTMDLRPTGISIGGSAKVSLSGSIKNLKIKFNLKESNLRITGLLHNEPMSDIVSTATTECFPEFINTYSDRIGELASGILEGVINGILNPPKEENAVNIPSSINDTVQIGPYTIKYFYQL